MIVMRSYLTEKQRNVPVLFGKTEVLRGENAAMFSLGPKWLENSLPPLQTFIFGE